MAAKKTGLITGSNAKIKINGITLAYATDVQYDISVQTIPIETMGRYEVLANEPIATIVSGSFSVVRYTNVAKTNSVDGAAGNGNGVGYWGAGAAKGTGVSTHLNPGDILTSETVDIEIYQKTKTTPSADSDVLLFKKINNARLTRMAGSVNKRGILMESFTFVAETMSDDSFETKLSGEADLS